MEDANIVVDCIVFMYVYMYVCTYMNKVAMCAFIYRYVCTNWAIYNSPFQQKAMKNKR